LVLQTLWFVILPFLILTSQNWVSERCPKAKHASYVFFLFSN
jgi:hypothetical protein